MVGNFIKETQYKVVTTVQEGVLASTPADVPTAPYSRFINSELANEIVAGVLLFPYFAYSLRTIYELKSIVGNTLLLFRASIQYKIIAFVKEDKEEKRKAEEGVGIK